MTPHNTPQDDEAFSDTTTIVPRLNHQARHRAGPSLACDDPDDESPFGCPCCVVPWFR
ncbi:hypothetical protein SK237_11355 [Novacetimonas hansenii]|uniref:hypothetical protein n=1 Tax=Acetobacteraceae TaxID=433 RepID=UPI0022311618|nr:hypothetical protein [Novacetimonas hansenii]